VVPGRGIETDVVSPAPRADWLAARADDPDALPTQSPAWLDAVCASGTWADASRLYRAADGRRVVLPMARRRLAGPVGVEASQPTHWGFGGIVADGGVTPADVDLVVRDLGSRRVAWQGIRPNPLHGRLYAERIPQHGVVIDRCAHVLDLAGGDEVVWKGFANSRRRAIRKAEKSAVEVELDTSGRLLPEFFELYAQNEARWAEQQHEPALLAKFRTRFRDTIGKWQAIARHLDGGCHQYLARLDGRPIASIIVLFGGNAHYTRGAMDKDLAGPVRANDLLMWHAIQDACAAGAPMFHLGESGRSPSLSEYKERFGARPHDYPELRIERIPVTAVDRAARSVVKRAIGFREP
jgi:CelD/BcsL family acetyltransferase involved in cellulose biosynthesis